MLLDLDNTKELMDQLGVKLEAQKVAEFFKEFDSDGSGYLDKDECRKLVAHLVPGFAKD